MRRYRNGRALRQLRFLPCDPFGLPSLLPVALLPLGRELGRLLPPPGPVLGLEPPGRDLEAKGFGFEPNAGFGFEPNAGLVFEPNPGFGFEPKAGLDRSPL
jgi:hypothetical protein